MNKHSITSIKTLQIQDWQLICLPVLSDNYVWMLTDLSTETKETLIIDPGVSEPIINYLQSQELTPIAILLTHHHYDHTDGVTALVETFKGITVYGPEETRAKGAQSIVKDQDEIVLFSKICKIIATPGHTLGHICYHLGPIVFTGDTLFSAGCGRLFEGSHQQMFDALGQLMTLPDETHVCPAHEYTLSNLKFAISIFKENQAIAEHLDLVESALKAGQPSLPSTIRLEKKINPYILCKNNNLDGTPIDKFNDIEALQRFTELRKLKDIF